MAAIQPFFCDNPQPEAMPRAIKIRAMLSSVYLSAGTWSYVLNSSPVPNSKLTKKTSLCTHHIESGSSSFWSDLSPHRPHQLQKGESCCWPCWWKLSLVAFCNENAWKKNTKINRWNRIMNHISSKESGCKRQKWINNAWGLAKNGLRLVICPRCAITLATKKISSVFFENTSSLTAFVSSREITRLCTRNPPQKNYNIIRKMLWRKKCINFVIVLKMESMVY